MFSIFPKDENFYKFLSRLSALAAESARQMHVFVTTGDMAARGAAASAIQAAKDEAKKISTQTNHELCRAFITPFDREDIHDFTADLYRIPKTINKVCEYLHMHGVEALDAFRPQVGIILKAAPLMDQMVAGLIRNAKNEEIAALAVEIDHLEHEGDEVFNAQTVALFKNTSDARQIIVSKDVHDMLEKVIDKYRNASEIAMQIALKHS